MKTWNLKGRTGLIHQAWFMRVYLTLGGTHEFSGVATDVEFSSPLCLVSSEYYMFKNYFKKRLAH